MRKVLTVLISLYSFAAFTQTADSLRAIMEECLVHKGKEPVHNFLLYASNAEAGFEFHEAAGIVGRNDTPIDKDFQFKVASITKTMVATVVMQLKEEGKLQVGDYLKSYLSDVPFVYYQDIILDNGRSYSDSITLLHLLTHTSGIADIFGDAETRFYLSVLTHPNREYTPQQIYYRYFKYGLNEKPANLPGKGYHYSDMNYMLLGFVIEKIEGKPLHEVLRERIIEPLEMDNTYFEYAEPARGKLRMADAYLNRINITKRINTSYEWAGGGIVSNTEDLHTFINGLFDNKLFQKEETLGRMMDFSHTRTFGARYALGLFQYDLDGDIYYGHGGYYGSTMIYCPEKQVSIVMNLGQSYLPFSTYELLKRISSLLSAL